MNSILAPALIGGIEAPGHKHLVCGLLLLAGPDRVDILGDMVAIHATAVDAEVTQCLSNLCTASPLSEQIPEGIYHFADTLGIVARNCYTTFTGNPNNF